jgi:hypothetical protein
MTSDPKASGNSDSVLERSRRIVRVIEGLVARGQAITPKAKMDYALARAVVERERQRAAAESERILMDRPEEFRQAFEHCRAIIKVVEQLRKEQREVTPEALQEYELACRFWRQHAETIRRLLDS